MSSEKPRGGVTVQWGGCEGGLGDMCVVLCRCVWPDTRVRLLVLGGEGGCVCGGRRLVRGVVHVCQRRMCGVRCGVMCVNRVRVWAFVCVCGCGAQGG